MTEKILLLYKAMRDKRTPWYAKLLCYTTLAYIISPIDIIPDFIPVIGLLDEIILVPIALWILFKMIPAEIRAEPDIKINKEANKKFYVSGIALILITWSASIYLAYYFWQH